MLALLLTLSIPATSVAAPTITRLSVRGLRIGKPSRIVVMGNDLLPGARLLLSAPIASQSVRPGATPTRVEFEVTVAPHAEAGMEALRVASNKGVSNAQLIGLDGLPQQPFAPKCQVPVALTGSISGPQILKTRFRGVKGQRIVAEVEARRLGSKLQPVVRILDARDRQLAFSMKRAELAGDARCEAVLPADGEYTVALHDLLYRAASPGVFRLKIGPLHYGNLVHPIGVTAGKPQRLKVIDGHLSKGSHAEVLANVPGRAPARLPASPYLSGSRPQVVVSDFTEHVEGPKKPVAAPVGLNGILSKPGEVDSYRVNVRPGAKLRLDVLARRLGSPLDGVLSVRTAQGKVLGRNDDRPGNRDPGLDVQLPGSVKQVIVTLRDQQGRGGDNYIYRIEVQDLGRPDFSLTVASDRVNLPVGAAQVLRVQANRRGYNGPIKLQVLGLPQDVQIAGDQIPAGGQISLLTLTATGDKPFAGIVSLIGEAVEAKPPLKRTALAPAVAGGQPWLRRAIALGSAPQSPLAVAWAAPKSGPLHRGLAEPLTVKLDRRGGAKGPVRLRLQTTQIMPKKTIKKNNKPQIVNDLERALRLSGSTLTAANADTGTARVQVPLDLADRQWGLVVIAELLAADKKTVLATAATPTRFYGVAAPVQVALAGPTNIVAKAGTGETGHFHGSLQRAPGFAAQVLVTLEGLPKGYKAPQVTVAAEQSEFKLPVRFAYGAKPAELKNIRLVARYIPDAKKPRKYASSKPVTVQVKVETGGKPEPKKPAKAAP